MSTSEDALSTSLPPGRHSWQEPLGFWKYSPFLHSLTLAQRPGLQEGVFHSICFHSLPPVYSAHGKGPPDELRDCLWLPRTTIRHRLVTWEMAGTSVHSLMEGRQASGKSHFVQNPNVISLSRFIGHQWVAFPVTSNPCAGALGESSSSDPHTILLQGTRS